MRRRTTRHLNIEFGSLSYLLILIGVFAQVCLAQSERGQDVVPRTLEVLDVGYKLPVEFVAVRHLQSKHWMRDLELEIRNLSSKPIYGLYIGLLLPDDKEKAPDTYWGASLFYGRMDLAGPDSRATDDDKPLSPGQTVVLKVDERIWQRYERHLQSSNVPEETSYKVRMIIETINFGDGTAFANGGIPFPFDGRTTARYKRFVRVPSDPE